MGTPLKEYYVVEKMHVPQPMFTRSTMSINSWDFKDFEAYIKEQKNAIVKSGEYETREKAEDAYEDPFLFPGGPDVHQVDQGDGLRRSVQRAEDGAADRLPLRVHKNCEGTLKSSCPKN